MKLWTSSELKCFSTNYWNHKYYIQTIMESRFVLVKMLCVYLILSNLYKPANGDRGHWGFTFYNTFSSKHWNRVDGPNDFFTIYSVMSDAGFPRSRKAFRCTRLIIYDLSRYCTFNRRTGINNIHYLGILRIWIRCTATRCCLITFLHNTDLEYDCFTK